MSYVTQDAPQQDSHSLLPSTFGAAPECILAGCTPTHTLANNLGASVSNNVWIATTETTASVAPHPPKNLAADIGNKMVTLTWDAPPPPITEYEIAARIGTVNPFVVVKTVPGSETSATVDTTNGMPYQFVAYAKNNASTSSASNIVKAVSISPPSAPTNISHTLSFPGVLLSWTAPPSSAAAPVDEYYTEIRIAIPDQDVQLNEGTIPANINSIGLPLYYDTRYSINMYAVNDIGRSQPATYYSFGLCPTGISYVWPAPSVTFERFCPPPR